MKDIAATFAYLKKALPLVLFALVPAAVMALLVRPFNYVAFFPRYAHAEIGSFSDVVWLVFDKYALTRVYPYLIVFVVALLSFSAMLSIVETHFRVGKFKLRLPLKNISNYIFPVFVTLGVILLVYMLCNFLLACAATLTHLLLSGAGRVTLVDYAAVAVVSLGIFLLMLLVLRSVFFWAPMMLVYGYNFLDAVIEAASMVSKAPRQVYFGLIFPFILALVAEAVIGPFRLPVWALSVVNTVVYTFIIVYIAAFIMVTTFRLTGMERRDLKRYY